jgi:serine/threonine protein phosphatase PrpC
MSIDQKPTNPDEIKRIASLGGVITNNLGVARVNGVLAVSRAFGNRKLRKVIRPDIEMMQRELTRDDDFLVMASDGLWDVLRNKDVCDICYSLGKKHENFNFDKITHVFRKVWFEY